MAKRKKKSSWLPWVLIIGVAGTAGFLFWSKLDRAKNLAATEDRANTIAAHAMIERCYELRAGETLHYQFKGEDLVAFDVRRGGDGMFSPQLLPFDEGDFTADSAGEYCLRFTNTLDRTQKFSWSAHRQLKP